MKTAHSPQLHSLSSAREGLLAMALIALTPVLIKQVHSDAIVIGVIRLAIAVVGVGIWYFLWSKRTTLRPSMLKALIPIGLLFGAHWLTYFISIKISTPSIAAVGLSSYGVHLIILHSVIERRIPSASIIFAVLLALSGTLLVTSNFIDNLPFVGGLVIGIISGFCHASLPLLHQRNQSIPLDIRTLGQFFFALLFFACFSPMGHWDIPASDWKYLLVLGLVCTLVGHALWVVASTKLPVQITSCLFYVGLPFTMLYEVMFLETPFEWQFLMGAAMIVLANVTAILIHSKGEQKKRTDKE